MDNSTLRKFVSMTGEYFDLMKLYVDNYSLILKRHFGASIRDMLGAAEHILVEGNFN